MILGKYVPHPLAVLIHVVALFTSASRFDWPVSQPITHNVGPPA